MAWGRVIGGLVGVAVALAVLWVDVPAAVACSCAAPLTDRDAYELADAVFVGDLVEERTDDRVWDTDLSIRLIFAVETAYKGEVFERQSVVTASSFDGALPPRSGSSPIGGGGWWPPTRTNAIIGSLALVGLLVLGGMRGNGRRDRSTVGLPLLDHPGRAPFGSCGGGRGHRAGGAHPQRSAMMSVLRIDEAHERAGSAP